MNEPVQYEVSVSRMSVIIIVAVCLLLAAVVVPAINKARLASRRATSAKNLQQLSLSCDCFVVTTGHLPAGARFDSGGTPTHGWYTRLLPYMASSQLWSRIDSEIPWKHPLNRHLFIGKFFCHEIPGVVPEYTADGFGTQHYLANPNLFYRNSATTFESLKSGISNCWLFGEATAPYAPLGYPFNWREIKYPLNTEGNYGGPWNGTQVAMADGSIRYISDNVSQEIINSLRDSSASVAEELKRKPSNKFPSGPVLKTSFFDLEPGRESAVAFRIVHDKHGVAETAWTWFKSKGPADPVDVGALNQLADTYPTLRGLVTDTNLDSAVLPAIHRWQNLKVLSVREVHVTQRELETLSSLQVFRYSATDAKEKAVQTALPHCELHRRQ
ncbi:MAG: DUF1559 domain-containing protein [Planctomycetaceae bacterium]